MNLIVSITTPNQYTLFSLFRACSPSKQQKLPHLYEVLMCPLKDQISFKNKYLAILNRS